MIGRIIWIGCVAVLGLVIAQLQLDRQAARDPSLMEWVAAPFRGNSQFLAATAALNAGDRPGGVEAARELLLRRPVPAENLTIYATALYRTGDEERASLAIQTAAQRGWREPLAQEARLRLALEAGDLGEAGTRYVALLLNPAADNVLLTTLGEQVLAEPGSEAETALAGLVSDTDRWHATFLGRGLQVMPPAAFARVAVASIARGTAFDCHALERVIGSLTARDAAAGQSMRTAALGKCPQLVQP